jgi:hypothetical protein
MHQDDNCRPALGRALVVFLRDCLAPALRLADTILPIRNIVLETARHTYEHFRSGFRLEYEDAGEPHGPSDEGLWRWLEEQFEERAH